MFKLIVRHPFKNYKKGDVITDQAEVQRLSHDRENHCIRVAMTADEIAALSPTKPASK
jgi:HD superfamily phosphohydrolase YqeK